MYIPSKKALLCATLACAAGANWAQSTVSIYGVADAGLVYEGGGPRGDSRTKMTSGVASGSRLGFRGNEDLGAGLSAIFALEMGLNIDTGASGQGGLQFGRQAQVGLKGAFGEVLMGRQYTPVAIVQTETDPFTTGLAGTSANMITAGGAGGNNRMNSTLRHSFNSPSGFTTDLVYGTGDTGANARVKRQYGGAIWYVAGPVYVKLGHHNVNDVNGTSAKVTFLGAKYDFGLATAHLNYVENKGSAVFGLVNADARDVLLGVSIPYGAGRFMLSYIDKNDRTAANHDARQYALGYIRTLSKRTSVYTSVARIRNNVVAGSSTGFYRVGNATEQGLGDRAFNVGVRHVF